MSDQHWSYHSSVITFVCRGHSAQLKHFWPTNTTRLFWRDSSHLQHQPKISTINLLSYYFFVYIYAYFLSLSTQSHIMFLSSMYFVSIWVSVLNVKNWRHAAASHMDVFLCELPLSSLQQYMRTQRLTWTKEIKAWEGPPSQQRQVPLKPKSTKSTQTWELGLHLNGMHLQNTS